MISLLSACLIMSNPAFDDLHSRQTFNYMVANSSYEDLRPFEMRLRRFDKMISETLVPVTKEHEVVYTKSSVERANSNINYDVLLADVKQFQLRQKMRYSVLLGGKVKYIDCRKGVVI